MKWEQIKPINTGEQKMGKDELRDTILKRKIIKKQLESNKEIFVIVYLPVQLALWAVGELSIKGVPLTGFSMILFTLIFGVLINGINKKIFKAELDIELLEEKLEA